jgi:hypothetical protein
VSAKDVPGWNSDITPWQEYIAQRIPRGGTYLEIGVFLGASLATMGELRPDINLIAVDPWLSPDLGDFAPYVAAHGGNVFFAFLQTMLEHAPDVLRRTRVIRGTAETVTLHGGVDLLFIDGGHDYASVRADLHAFAPLVRYGTGIIAGHDYQPDLPGVIAAVDEYFPRVHVGTPAGEWSSVWWVDV